MNSIIIIPFEEKTPAIFAGIREFPTDKVILIVPAHKISEAEKIVDELKNFMIPAEISTLKDYTSFEEFFSVITKIKLDHKGTPLMMNLGASKEPMHCIALSAAFVNGIQSFTLMENKTFFFPILKFSYYDVLSDNKLKILNLLYKKQCCDSLEDLAKKATMGPSLINYHIYGNEKNPGLKELGMINMAREKGKIKISLTTMGRLIMNQSKDDK